MFCLFNNLSSTSLSVTFHFRDSLSLSALRDTVKRAQERIKLNSLYFLSLLGYFSLPRKGAFIGPESSQTWENELITSETDLANYMCAPWV